MAIYLRAKGRTSPPAKTIGHRESINPTLAVNLIMAIYLYANGRTTLLAKITGHRESFNPALAVLKLVAKYLVTTIYSNMLPKKNRTNCKRLPKKVSDSNLPKNQNHRQLVLDNKNRFSAGVC